jgi:DNA-binding FrmR family transcriptional regulator
VAKNLSELEKKLVTRINRVKGQLAGIVRMIEEGEDTKKISIQISASVSGMDAVKETYMKVRLLEEAMKSMTEIIERVKD